MDLLRQEAEKRVSSRDYSLAQATAQRNSQRASRRVLSQTWPGSPTKENEINTNQILATHEAAVLADIDFKLNGARARANSKDFIGPRWVPDEEVAICSNTSCQIEFDWYNRKHHCRHCGLIFCDACCTNRLLLPKEFAMRNPQRVCQPCHIELKPLQATLTNDIANHQRVNAIEPISGNASLGKNLRRYMNLPFSLTMGAEIRKAAYTTYNLFTLAFIKDKGIPLSLLQGAKGLAFLTTLKGGFMFGGRFGTGLVIAKLPSGRWSAPSAIGTLGVSWGALIGADVTDYVIILNDIEAVEAFSGVGQVMIGGGVDVAIGPVGRTGAVGMHIGDGGIASAYSYSHSRGVYAGVSLDGAVIFARDNVNFHFYGRQVSPPDILRGYNVPPPRAAQPLYDALGQAFVAAPAASSTYSS